MMTQSKKSTSRKPAAKKAAAKKPRRPSKAKRKEVRRAASAALGEMEKVSWLWNKQHQQQDAVDYQSRRYAIYALAGGAILFLAAITDLIPFGQIMAL